MFAVQAPLGGGPAETVRHLNEHLAARHVEARFATLVYAVIAKDGRLTYANAGHNAPALLTRRGTHRLVPGGPILGAFTGVTFDQETIQLDDRDTLVMFTDGVTEARSRSDEEFGEARLLGHLEGVASLPAADLLHRIFEGVREFCQDADQSDDITATVTRFSLTV
jgi:sigma-B regulation protein RsbU (phosphoserine phosphatase)